jgi:CheY-like chemotaxis protein
MSNTSLDKAQARPLSFIQSRSLGDHAYSCGDGPPGRTLLVVEDEILVALQVSELMEIAGWTIVGPASSLDEALTLVADGQRIDAAVLDINLDGTPVYPLADTLRERGIPILFCTGYEMLGEPERFADCACLNKPVGAHEIIPAVNALIAA